MIRLLHIENIAVIEKAEIAFGPGLNVLTGETGAGKSIVIDALAAVTGGRSSKELVRTGSDGALCTAEFFKTGPDIFHWLEEAGIGADDCLILTRRIASDGKNACRVNGCPVTVSQLRELGGLLIDIHGQNDGRRLLDEASHLGFLDGFGGLDTVEYAGLYRDMRAKEREIMALQMDESEKERLMDSLRYQIGEIEQAAVTPGEYETLYARRELLKNASVLTEALNDACEALDGSERSDGAVALLSDAQSGMISASRHFETFGAIAQKLDDVKYSAIDILDELRGLRRELEYSPEELDGIEARCELLRRCMRKYGGSEEEILKHLQRTRLELDDIGFASEKIARLRSELNKISALAEKMAERLTEQRGRAAAVLEKRIMDELTALSMPGVSFQVELERTEALSAAGLDQARFLMSANEGEAPGRLSRIASGGELSRIMLAMKNVLSENDPVGVLVFDEIDSGVSGIAAQRVGEKLSDLALNRQVLCVTHLPQIAVMADTHFEIIKRVSDGRTYTDVRELDGDGRALELARLTGGENVTATTLLSADEQLKASEAYKARRG